jgi:N-acetylglutamate synthase-like GNAT family acetyltransferase
MPPADLTYEVLGDPPDGPTLRLDHERFAYAGKFVMTNTGKAVARADGEIVAAVAFNRDRTDDTVAWMRYITVRNDRRGEGIGPRLAGVTATHLHETGADRVRIAVNNPYAYVACYRAGFAYANRETGIAEVVLERRPATASSPAADRDQRFRDGLDALLAAADRPEGHREFARNHQEGGSPDPVDLGDIDLAVRRGDAPDRPSPHD